MKSLKIAKPAEPVNGKMNGLRPPLTAPPVFAVEQSRGDSKVLPPLVIIKK